jgi:hypothetical protein
MIIGQMTITIEPEDIRRYTVAQDWTDDQVQAFIARWQSSITDQLVDTLLGPGGLLADYMSDPDCLALVTTPDNTRLHKCPICKDTDFDSATDLMEHVRECSEKRNAANKSSD